MATAIERNNAAALTQIAKGSTALALLSNLEVAVTEYDLAKMAADADYARRVNEISANLARHVSALVIRAVGEIAELESPDDFDPDED